MTYGFVPCGIVDPRDPEPGYPGPSLFPAANRTPLLAETPVEEGACRLGCAQVALRSIDVLLVVANMGIAGILMANATHYVVCVALAIGLCSWMALLASLLETRSSQSRECCKWVYVLTFPIALITIVVSASRGVRPVTPMLLALGVTSAMQYLVEIIILL